MSVLEDLREHFQKLVSSLVPWADSGSKEALELIDGVFGSMWTVSQFGFGIISAYCLLAYYIGAKLSFFQVSFVNASFFAMNAVTNLSIINAFRRLDYVVDNLSDHAVEAMRWFFCKRRSRRQGDAKDEQDWLQG